MWYSWALLPLLLTCVVSPVSTFRYDYETNTLPPECAAVLCLRPDCDDAFTPPGQCCPICRPAGKPGTYRAGTPGTYQAGKPGTFQAGKPGTYQAGKPGTCPNFPSIFGGLCMAMCDSDSDCMADQKCCLVGCMRVCISPEVKGTTCYYHGKVYKDGANFKDYCNACRCNGGYVECTEVGCLEEKPGQCPAGDPDAITICLVECQGDNTCPGNQKCCSNGCHVSCTNPVLFEEKPGQCPAGDPDAITICLVECQGDDTCPGNQKCCSNGCHVSCTNPVLFEEKPGQCPAGDPDAITICLVECQGDNTCPGNQKCCSNGCRVSCTDPVGIGQPCVANGRTYRDGETFNIDCNGCSCQNGSVVCTLILCEEKPGACPAVEPGTVGICVVGCAGDSSCPGDEKCCSNGCGSGCISPKVAEKSCNYKGKVYKEGESFKDDCNTCKCSNGNAACTRMACPVPDKCASVACLAIFCEGQYRIPGECCPVCPCLYKGKKYKNGESFMDDCNNCTCGGIREVTCTKKTCGGPGGKPCISNGKTYQDGESFKVDCNTCTCRNGIPLCTLIACQDKPGKCPIFPPGNLLPCVTLCGSDFDCPGLEKCCSTGCGRSCSISDGSYTGCAVNGKKYKEGEEIPSDPKDPCKRCMCTGGKVTCDSILCPACAGYRPPGACCNICGAKPSY